MYYPKEEQIKRAGPRPGMFYWATRAVNVAEIARVAAKNSPTPISTAEMVALIAGSSWNHHVRYSSKGYTSYGIEGPQMEAKYSSTDYTAGYGTGTSWPMLWIPTADGKEPEDVYGSPSKPVLEAPPSSGGGTGVFTPGTPSSGGGTTIRPGAGQGGDPSLFDQGGASSTGSGGGASRDSKGRIVAAGVGGSSSGLLMLLLLLGVGAVGWMYTRGSGKKKRRKKRK